MKLTFTLLGLILTTVLVAQNQQQANNGNVIKNFGKTYNVSQIDFKTDASKPYKVVFDIGRDFNNPLEPNALIESAARFLNMHEKAGVPLKNMRVAIVVHGSAAKDLLSTNYYMEKVDGARDNNPNLLLISELTNHDVEIILCGQTAASMGITKAMIHPNVQISLSAMTALVQLQNEGYRLINF